MRLSWSPSAIGDLRSIEAYIAEDSPVAADKVLALIVSTVDMRLLAHPASGRPGRVRDTRW